MPTIVKRSFVILFLSTLMLVTYAAPVSADGTDSAKIAAKGQLEEGARLFEQGEYQGALARFKNAYGLYPSPKIQFNFGQAYRALGRNDEAIAAFKRFLNEASDTSIALRAEAEQYIRELQLSPPLNEKTAPPVPSPQPQSVPPPAAAPALRPPVPSPAPLSNDAPITGSASSEKAKVDDQQIGQTRWWLWGTIGGAVVVGVVSLLILGRDTRNPDCLGITPCGSVH